jgi:DNA-binding NarL/FixJ family response regulator
MAKVVIADDSPRAQMFVATAFRNAGHNVVGIAADGSAAVVQCRLQKPDLAILDIAMQPMNGLEAEKIIVSGQLARHVLIVSSNMQAGFIAQARSIGAQIIGKTNDAKHLIAKVNELVPGFANGT